MTVGCAVCVLQVRGLAHHPMMTLPNHHFLEPKEMAPHDPSDLFLLDVLMGGID